jgi:hypothetical protein
VAVLQIGLFTPALHLIALRILTRQQGMSAQQEKSACAATHSLGQRGLELLCQALQALQLALFCLAHPPCLYTDTESARFQLADRSQESHVFAHDGDIACAGLPLMLQRLLLSRRLQTESTPSDIDWQEGLVSHHVGCFCQRSFEGLHLTPYCEHAPINTTGQATTHLGLELGQLLRTVVRQPLCFRRSHFGLGNGVLNALAIR